MKFKAKKILIISYYWPPSGGSGVQRWIYFAKYLKAFGWEPYVLTVDENSASYSVLDQSLLSEVNDIPTIRTKTIEPLKWYSRLNSGSTYGGIPQGSVTTKTVFGKLTAFIRGNFFIPDARKGWRPFALNAAQKLIKDFGIDKVVTTGPPHSSHWVGAQLQYKFGIKWFVDLRDPWVTVFYNKQLYRTSWAIKNDKKQEQKIILKADAVITTLAGGLHRYLKNIAPNQNFLIIPNGYDTELMNTVTGQTFPEFHVVFTGLLTKNQEYEGFLSVLDELQYEHSICISFAGQIQSEILTEFKVKLKKVRIVEHGYISHYKAIELMKSADLLLNFIFKGAQNDMISGKILEYIATKKPILSIGNPDSEAGKFIMQGTAAKMIEAVKAVEIMEFIKHIIKGEGKIINNFPNIENWSRKALTEKLEKFLLDY